MQSFSTLLVIPQVSLCPFDIPFLCILASATEQRYRITGPGEINPISWPEVEPQFVDSATYRTVIAQKSQIQATKTVFHTGLRSNIPQYSEPFGERLSAVWGRIDFYSTLDHYSY